MEGGRGGGPRSLNYPDWVVRGPAGTPPARYDLRFDLNLGADRADACSFHGRLRLDFVVAEGGALPHEVELNCRGLKVETALASQPSYTAAAAEQVRWVEQPVAAIEPHAERETLTLRLAGFVINLKIIIKKKTKTNI